MMGLKNWPNSVVLGLALLIIAVLGPKWASGSCPGQCSCKWKGGKEWVECAGKGLSSIPIGAREESQVLDLSRNEISYIGNDTFMKLALINLQKLFLGSSLIRDMAPKSLNGLLGLVELDLSGNLLENVPSECLSHTTSLMRLNLRANPIERVKRGAFRRLTQLTFLDLSGCRLSLIEYGAFEDLMAIEWLRLDENHLANVPPSTLPIGNNLRGLQLHGNPWRCDCELRPLRKWFDDSGKLAPQEAEPTCSGPRKFLSKPLKDLRPIELACLPRVYVSEFFEIYEGDNVTLNCEVSAVPKAKNSWWFNGELMLTSQIQGENESESRIRFSETEEDGNNVTYTLQIFGLEVQEDGIYTCLAENSAGIVTSNSTIRVLRREPSLTPPTPEGQANGYAAAIAAGALLGTLLALGCLFFGIILYARKLKSRGKSNLKASLPGAPGPPAIPGATAPQPTSILKNSQNKKPLPATNNFHQQEIANVRIDSPPAVLESSELAEMAYLRPRKYLIEPDLINEVPAFYPGPRPSCLDQDGYPLNFGLPKIGIHHHNIGGTLPPRFRQRSAAQPIQRHSREAEFLAQSARLAYDVHGLGCTYKTTTPLEVVPVPFIPSPPAAYRGEPIAELPSPRATVGKTALEAPAAIVNPPRVASLESVEHPESPDEGYVGDVMDV